MHCRHQNIDECSFEKEKQYLSAVYAGIIHKTCCQQFSFLESRSADKCWQQGQRINQDIVSGTCCCWIWEMSFFNTVSTADEIPLISVVPRWKQNTSDTNEKKKKNLLDTAALNEKICFG